MDEAHIERIRALLRLRDDLMRQVEHERQSNATQYVADYHDLREQR